MEMPFVSSNPTFCCLLGTAKFRFCPFLPWVAHSLTLCFVSFSRCFLSASTSFFLGHTSIIVEGSAQTFFSTFPSISISLSTVFSFLLSSSLHFVYLFTAINPRFLFLSLTATAKPLKPSYPQIHYHWSLNSSKCVAMVFLADIILLPSLSRYDYVYVFFYFQIIYSEYLRYINLNWYYLNWKKGFLNEKQYDMKLDDLIAH
ncbi:hypothetical protein DVH24_005221 [Malus domestica]|uniref:Uncharacterized protein n=1 Tax=Malus domestica TaxID=3750 RepID=A0A498IH27_MALDO|nr:hypothetical protein DVH24_005221 [Malus domestica]